MKEYPVKKRIVFIDMMRAYAILMMVQGHLVDACLDPIYRDPHNTLYFIWNFMRGITAPVFFFASGMIFSYLLMKEEDRSGVGFKNTRVWKGIKRTGFLLLVGYILRFNYWFLIDLFDGSLGKDYSAMIAVDVLHVIGLAIFCIIISYLIANLLKIRTYILLILGGFASFLFYPDILNADFSNLNIFISNYLTKANGSNFTIIPWVGFSLFGGAFGVAIWKHPGLIRSYTFAILLLVFGILIHNYSSQAMIYLYEFTNWNNLKALAYNNFLFFRLGHVFISVSVFMTITFIFKNIPAIIPKIGSETLMIYVVHSFIIYGSVFQVGIAQSWGKSLTPVESGILAAALVLFFVVLVYYYDNIKEKFNSMIDNFLLGGSKK